MTAALHLLEPEAQSGYRLYAKGVSTPETRAAKSAYMATKREQARLRREAWELANPGVPYVVDGITHGIGGYTNESCRCRTCRRAAKLMARH